MDAKIIARAIYNDRNGVGAKPWARLPHSYQGPYLSDARAALSALEAEGAMVVPRKLLTEAHAVMRECGWHLAAAAEPQSDGILEAARAEVEAAFAELIAARPR